MSDPAPVASGAVVPALHKYFSADKIPGLPPTIRLPSSSALHL